MSDGDFLLKKAGKAFTLAASYDIISSDKGSTDMAESKFNKSEYDMDYQKNHKSSMTLWFNNDKDEDILSWLNEVEMNKSEYIRDLIRQDMNKNKKKAGK